MEIPRHYQTVKKYHPEYIAAVERLGQALKAEGPLDNKTSHLVQLAASIACGSEGAAHSHTRQALEAGVSAEEIRHCVILLTSTLGFPRAMAGLSWVNDVLDK